MALTYATGFTTNKLSSAVNTWWDYNAIPSVVKNNGVLFAMGVLQGPGPMSSPGIGNMIVRKQRVEGNQLVCRHMGEVATWSLVADSAEMDTVTLTDNDNQYGAQVFDWGHAYTHVPHTTSHQAIIRGAAARTNSWLDDLMNYAKEGWYDKLETGIMSNDDAARGTIGGLQYAVDTTNTYGGINRATAGNENFQAYKATVTNPTTSDLDTMRLSIIKAGGFKGNAGGFNGVGISGMTPFRLLMQELKGYQSYMTDTWNKFPMADKLAYGGIIHVFSHKGSDTDMFYVDPRACRLYLDTSLTAKGPIPIPNVKGAHDVFVFDYWCQFLVPATSWTGRIAGITGA